MSLLTVRRFQPVFSVSSGSICVFFSGPVSLKLIASRTHTNYVELETCWLRQFPHWLRSALVPNSTTRTAATVMLYSTTNGQAHNNSTTCCTANSPPNGQKFATSQCQSPTCQDVGMWQFLSVGGDFVVQQDKLQNCCELVRWWCCTTCP